MSRAATSVPVGDPLWYKDAIVYEVPVRTYRDSDGDGIGDFRGLIEKLDHIRDLGATAVWLLPFYPSPWRDGGYDISDYRAVSPEYGTLADFRRLVRESHRRGLRVITEIVCNHTSDQHPWFQAARRAAPGSVARNRYVWSDSPDRFADARIIFTDTEPSNWSWDPVARAWYWHRFFSHQPDLNFEEPAVHRALFAVIDHWLGMGVDGIRLDAIPYLYEREGTNCENLPETHAFLKALRAHVDERFPGRMLLAEANQWPEKAVAYFGEGAGDECHMCFHFPVMPRLYMALRREDRYPIVDILEQTPAIPETAQWGMFLRNHDELTLEMVTDEERDFMYRVYAEDPQMRLNLGIRRRLAPLVGRDRRRMELLHGLLFSLPGTPFVYYGDEIGMGDDVSLGDRDGVRTPMQWSTDRNAGFSEADPSLLCLPLLTDPRDHYMTVNVESQRRDPHSWFSWMRRLIELRKRCAVFGRGTLEMLAPRNPRVLAFLREGEGQTILVVANLSRFVQPVALDLPRHAGWQPTELFGQTAFPMLPREGSWPLSLGPHSFLWFALEPQREVTGEGRPRRGGPPVMAIPERWPSRADEALARSLEEAIAEQVPSRAWFRRRLARRNAVAIHDVLPVDPDGRLAIVLARTRLADGEETLTLLPLAISDVEVGGAPDVPDVMAVSADGARVVHDAAAAPWLGSTVLSALGAARRGLHGWHGRIEVDDAAALRRLVRLAWGRSSVPARVGARNVSLDLGSVFLKLYRRLEPGDHVELEVGRHLRAQRPAGILPLTVGLAWHDGGPPLVVGGVGPSEAGQGDGWSLAVEAVAGSLERQSSGQGAGREGGVASDWLGFARRFGERTAELHLALARVPDRAFHAEPLGELYQRSLYQAIRNRCHETLESLERADADPVDTAIDAARLRELRPALDALLRGLLDHPFDGRRIRCHGDLRLGHFRYAGGDLRIVDFEGDPARPMSERRLPRSPLRDVASLLASFTQAAGAGLHLARQRAVVRDGGDEAEAWLISWLDAVAGAVVAGHAAGLAAHDPPILPTDPADARVLLRCLLADAILRAIADPGAGPPGRSELLVPLLEAVVFGAWGTWPA